MRFLTLEQCKKHVYIDHDEDDVLIELYASSAENAIENYLNVDLEYEYDADTMPADILSAMLLFFGSLFNNREGFTTMNTQPNASILALVKPYKNYGYKRR